jgi:hypothetical protein
MYERSENKALERFCTQIFVRSRTFDLRWGRGEFVGCRGDRGAKWIWKVQARWTAWCNHGNVFLQICRVLIINRKTVCHGKYDHVMTSWKEIVMLLICKNGVRNLKKAETRFIRCSKVWCQRGTLTLRFLWISHSSICTVAHKSKCTPSFCWISRDRMMGKNWCLEV